MDNELKYSVSQSGKIIILANLIYGYNPNKNLNRGTAVRRCKSTFTIMSQ